MNERTRRTGGAYNNNQYIQDLSKPPIVKLPGPPASVRGSTPRRVDQNAAG